MDFDEQIQDLSNKVEDLKSHAYNEANTTNYLVYPFLSILGFDISNPSHLTSEDTADTGTRQSEKVDIGVTYENGGKVIIEVKPVTNSIDDEQSLNQIKRYYYNTPSAKIAILTNGIKYKFFSDFDDDNRLDDTSFFEFNLADYGPSKVAFLEKFRRDQYDLDDILPSAEDMKYTRMAKAYIERQFHSPEEAFVKVVMDEFYQGRKTENAVERMTDCVANALQEIRTQHRNLPYTEALAHSEFYEQEMFAFNIVKAIASEALDDLSRLKLGKERKTYTPVLLDNNRYKTIVRFWFDVRRSSYKIEFINSDSRQKGEKIELGSLGEIYKFRTAIHESLNACLAS